MAQGRLLRRLIKAGAEDPRRRISSGGRGVVREEGAKPHHLLANDLERFLYGSQEGAGRLPAASSRDEAKDRERGLAILEVRSPLRDPQDIVLSNTNCSALEQTVIHLLVTGCRTWSVP